MGFFSVEGGGGGRGGGEILRGAVVKLMTHYLDDPV